MKISFFWSEPQSQKLTTFQCLILRSVKSAISALLALCERNPPVIIAVIWRDFRLHYFLSSIAYCKTRCCAKLVLQIVFTLIYCFDREFRYNTVLIFRNPRYRIVMMASSNGNILRVTGHLCGEFTGDRWIPRTKASDAELWCFLWSASE